LNISREGDSTKYIETAGY